MAVLWLGLNFLIIYQLQVNLLSISYLFSTMLSMKIETWYQSSQITETSSIESEATSVEVRWIPAPS